jgi:hypothetical protein
LQPDTAGHRTGLPPFRLAVRPRGGRMVADDWVLLSTCVARMGELHPKYRSHLGYARRDLKVAICAGRARLRGHRPGQADDPPTAIEMPITSRHTLDDLSHNSLSVRTRPHVSNLLFRDVEVEWNSIAEYLRARSAECWPTELSGKRPSSRRPDCSIKPNAREFADNYIRGEKSAGRRPTQKGLEGHAKANRFKGGRDDLRRAFSQLQHEAGDEVNRGRPKKSPP